MPFRSHLGIAARFPNRTSTLNPGGFSGCAAPASGFTCGTGRDYSPLAQLRGPRLRHALLPAGVMGVGLTADGTPLGVASNPTTDI